MLLCIAVILLLCRQCRNSDSSYWHQPYSTSSAPAFLQSVFRDTVFITKQRPALKMMNVRPRIITVHDTIISARPFRTEIDTVLGGDTLHTEYAFPQNLFSLTLTRKPDTLSKEIVVIDQVRTKPGNWWEKPLIFIAGTAAGIIFSNLSK